AVVPEGPAHRAGLLAGDIVTRLDGIPIPDASALVHAVSRRKPGETAVLEIRRGEETTRIRIELGG
ncbi:MAG: PDZ domain-containing protein, partial [Betaproteobacteria bacterium]|nr:PDZ domain-containing protein [Betaproteobacteria bacterium]